jgi:CheY-like chemotaxis protein
MPVVDGRSLLIRLRAGGSTVPVIVVSSAANAAMTAEMTALGAAAVLRKPPSPAAACESLRLVPGALAR